MLPAPASLPCCGGRFSRTPCNAKTYPLASKPLGILNTSRLFFAIPICDLFINKCSFFISKLDLKNRFWDPHLILMFGCFCNAAKIRMLEGTLSED